MINEEEKFDDLIRQKMSDREFFFDELNWDKVNDQIERSEKRRNYKRFALILASGIAIGVLITVPVMSVLNNNRNNKLIASSNTKGSVTPAENTEQPLATGNASGPSLNTLNRSQPVVASSSPIADHSNTNTGASQPPVNKSLPANEVTVNNSAVSEKRIQHQSNSSIAFANKKSIHSTANTQNISGITKTIPDNTMPNVSEEQASASSANRNATNKNQSSLTDLTQVTNTNIANTSNKAEMGVANAQTTNTSTDITNKNNTISSAAPEASNSPAHKDAGANTMQSSVVTTNQPANINITSGSAGSTISNSSVPTDAGANTQTAQTLNIVTGQTANKNTNADSSSNAITTAASKEEKQSTQTDVKKSPDTAFTGSAPAQLRSDNLLSIEQALPSIKPATSYTKNTNILSVDAGPAYSLGWKDNENSEGAGISPVIGVSATHFFSSRTALELGVQYNALNNLKTSYSNSATSYDFGYNNTTTTVTPNSIYYVALPLTLQYHINDNNAIGIGASALFLINTSSTVVTSTQADLTPITTQTTKTLGYTNGFNTMDLQARIAYRRRIYKSFSVTAEGYYGFMDIESNSFFSDNSFNRNSGIRLIFSYDLIK